MQRRIGATMAILAAVAAGWAAIQAGEPRLAAQSATSPAVQAPAYQVEQLWPKPLPHHWILGSVTGVAVDSRDHIWIVHRGADSMSARNENGLGTDPPTAEVCCMPAPPVLEFDAAGNLINQWGGPGAGYDWPATPGGIAIDAQGHVWIAAAGWPEPPAARGGGAGARGAGRAGGGGAGGAAATPTPAAAPAPPAPPARPVDAHILEFSATGTFIRQIGKPGATEGSAGKTTFNRPANIDFDAAANELYVADGYGNRRVVVLDATTGAYKRHWGAYGAMPIDADPGPYDPKAPAARQFRAVTCVTVAKDGLVYVCDRASDRIQVFRKTGAFVKEMVVAGKTLSNGSVWDIALSADPGQQYLFVADGQEHTVLILDRRSLRTVGSIGTGGRIPGRFNAVGSVAVDSHGNLYTAETYEGKRLQKFTPGR